MINWREGNPSELDEVDMTDPHAVWSVVGPPPAVGAWRFPCGTVYAAPRKPNWWHRLWHRLLLGWKWEGL